MVQQVCILGASGSIGQSTLDVIARHPGRYQVYALTAAKRADILLQQIRQFKPPYAVMVDETAAQQLRSQVASENLPTQILSGSDALCDVASAVQVDMVMAAIVGAAGLLPTLAAARAGKKVLLANKEALVMSGQLFMDTVKKSGASLLPIDSEHNAIFQCLPVNNTRDNLSAGGVSKILLTASGGPFRGWDKTRLDAVTPVQAVKHPNWSMGQKISVDSATLMNKGLELIEACWLFDVTPADIEVVVHPQSVIHSMVQYVDGSVLAQLGNPDMRTPIAYGMAWPERIDAGVKNLNLFDIARLDFCAPDHANFPCLGLAAQAFAMGGTAPAVLNAANEVAVEAFLQEQIPFTRISELIKSTLAAHQPEPALQLERILAADKWARSHCHGLLE